MIRVEETESELTKKVEINFLGKFVKVVDDSDNFCILPETVAHDVINRVKSIKVYEDDVWLITNQKCGTTWTQEMAWLMLNNLDFDQSSEVFLEKRSSHVEFECFISGYPPQLKELSTTVDEMTRPRLIKTHLPAFLLPDEIWTVKPKIIYVTRNPKDACVSAYHHHVKGLQWKLADLDVFVRAFVEDQMLYSPFNDHVLKFWELHNQPNILFLHFEDMKRDLKSIVLKTAKFLGKSFTSDEVDKLCDHLSFEKMKNNPAINKKIFIDTAKEIFGGGLDSDFNFIRKGQVGSFKEDLTSEQIALLDFYGKTLEAKCDFRYKFK